MDVKLIAAVAAVVIALLLVASVWRARRKDEHEKVAEKWVGYKKKEIEEEEEEKEKAEEARKRTISILGGGVEYERKDLVKPGLLIRLLKVAAVLVIFAGVAAVAYWVLVSGPYGSTVRMYAAEAGNYSTQIGLVKATTNSILDRIQCILHPGSNVCHKSLPKQKESGISISDMRSTDVKAGYQTSFIFTIRNMGNATATGVHARVSANGMLPLSMECGGGVAKTDGCYYESLEQAGYRYVTAIFDVPCMAGGSDYRFDMAVGYGSGANKTATLPSQIAYQSGPGKSC